jgi:hypothetical protein
MPYSDRGVTVPQKNAAGAASNVGIGDIPVSFVRDYRPRRLCGTPRTTPAFAKGYSEQEFAMSGDFFDNR